MERPAVEGRTAAVLDMICLDLSSRALRATTEPPLFGRRFFFFRFGEVFRVNSMGVPAGQWNLNRYEAPQTRTLRTPKPLYHVRSTEPTTAWQTHVCPGHGPRHCQFFQSSTTSHAHQPPGCGKIARKPVQNNSLPVAARHHQTSVDHETTAWGHASLA